MSAGSHQYRTRALRQVRSITHTKNQLYAWPKPTYLTTHQPAGVHMRASSFLEGAHWGALFPQGEDRVEPSISGLQQSPLTPTVTSFPRICGLWAPIMTEEMRDERSPLSPMGSAQSPVTSVVLRGPRADLSLPWWTLARSPRQSRNWKGTGIYVSESNLGHQVPKGSWRVPFSPLIRSGNFI